MIKKILSSRKGEGYIDVCIGIVVFVMVLILAINIFGFITLKVEMDQITEDLIEAATFSGEFNGDFWDANDYNLQEYFYYDIDYGADYYFNPENRQVQLGTRMWVTVSKETYIKGLTKTYLYITVSHKTPSEMATTYGFTSQQKEILTELLSDEFADLWSSVLYGISGGSKKIISVATMQVGNSGGQPYWSWYGFGSRVEWCACFVSWCANECGYIDAGIIPKFASCDVGMTWFKEHSRWQSNTYTPREGDIIFFDWDSDGYANHVGIVEKVENGKVHTIEGNSDDACKKLEYNSVDSRILGYGVPIY